MRKIIYCSAISLLVGLLIFFSSKKTPSINLGGLFLCWIYSTVFIHGVFLRIPYFMVYGSEEYRCSEENLLTEKMKRNDIKGLTLLAAILAIAPCFLLMMFDWEFNKEHLLFIAAFAGTSTIMTKFIRN